MWGKRIIGLWRDAWRGPAVRLEAGSLDTLLGRGEPRAEVILHDPGVLRRMLLDPSLAFGEAYMDGRAEVRGDLIAVLEGYYRTAAALTARWPARAWRLLRSLPRPVGRARAIANAQHHYDLGNSFYRLWLDASMTYSCGYFVKPSDRLEDAQRQKNELVLRKLRVEPGQRLLDIGCGWGALVLRAAERFGVVATGLTPSVQQADYIEREAQRRGLAGRVRVIRGDWRDLGGQYDRVVSVGMFEHVGREQSAAFLRRWRDLLAPGGLSLLHTIGRMRPQPVDRWIRRYIFPGGYLPTLAQLADHTGAAGLRVADAENLHAHYALTLSCWRANYERVWDRVVRERGERFARMWRLYLAGSEAGFRWGGLQLWQLVVDHAGAPSPWPLVRELGVAPGFAAARGPAESVRTPPLRQPTEPGVLTPR